MGWTIMARGAILASLMVFGAGARAQAVPALAVLESGNWEVRADGEPVRNLCVADPAALVQLRHAGQQCTRIVVENARGEATLAYQCHGAGWGRTTLRVSTPRLATIETQGIAANAPFAFTAEARRTGACGGIHGGGR